MLNPHSKKNAKRTIGMGIQADAWCRASTLLHWAVDQSSVNCSRAGIVRFGELCEGARSTETEHGYPQF